LARGAPFRGAAVDAVIAAGFGAGGRPPERWRPVDLEALGWFGLLDAAEMSGIGVEELVEATLAVAEVVDADGRRGLVDALLTLIGARPDRTAPMLVTATETD